MLLNSSWRLWPRGGLEPKARRCVIGDAEQRVDRAFRASQPMEGCLCDVIRSTGQDEIESDVLIK